MRVRITGRPRQNEELEDLVGRIGEVTEVKDKPEGRGKVFLITDLPDGDVWLAEGYCEEVIEEREEVA